MHPRLERGSAALQVDGTVRPRAAGEKARANESAIGTADVAIGTRRIGTASLCGMVSKDLIVGAAAGAALAYAASKLLSALAAKRTAAITGDTKFFYWPARGRGEQVRLALAEAGVSFEAPSFQMGDQASTKAYFDDCRSKGGNLTTNVPMLFMDGQYFTQSSAVLKFVARKFGMYPADLLAAYEVDNLIAAADDLRSANYKPMKMFRGGEKELKAYLEGLPKHVENLARLLGSRDYFAAVGFTVADLTIYDALDVTERQVPGTLAKYPTLKAFHVRVEARPNIAKWIASEERGKLFAFPAL